MRAWLLVLGLLAGALPPFALAQPDGSDPGAAVEDEPPPRYQELIREGLTEYGARNWPEARALFRRAHRLFPNARTLRGIGMVDYELRDYASAVRHLRQALADPRRPLTETQRSEVEELLELALAFVGRYRLEGAPPGSRIEVDGRRAELEEDGSLLLSLGSHRILVLADGRRAERQVTVRGGEDEALPIVFPAVRPAETAVPDPAAPREIPLDPAPAGPPPDRTGAWALLLGGAGLTVVGLAVLIAGLADFFTVQNAQPAANREWAEVEGAFDRAPVLTGVGIASLAAGGSAMLSGALWFALGGRAPVGGDVGLELRVGGWL